MVQKQEEREHALLLRRKGLSYREILKKVPVAKSTLSLWLRSVGLSKRQKQRLTQKKLDAIHRGGIKRHQDRLLRWKKISDEAANEITKLSKREKWLAGILLYWAEGSKEKASGSATNIKFSNSDPSMIKLFRDWLFQCVGIKKQQVVYELYIHERADIEKALKFWSSKLRILKNDIRIYLKRHNNNPKRLNISSNYNGLIRINVRGTIALVRKIDGWIRGIARYWGVV